MTVHPLTLRPTKSALPHRSSCGRPSLRCRYIGQQQQHSLLSSTTAMSFVPPSSSCQKPALIGKVRQLYVDPSSSVEQQSGEDVPKPLDQTSASSLPAVIPSCFTFSDSEDDALSVNSDASSRNEESSHESRRRVQFASSVSVWEIPSRHSYPEDIKHALWNSRKQIRRAASRNSFEYAWEGHNWRTAVEEEHFLPLHGGRQWIHPAHLPTWEKHNQYRYHQMQYQHQQRQQKQQLCHLQTSYSPHLSSRQPAQVVPQC